MEPKPGKVDTGGRSNPLARAPRCNVEIDGGRLCRQPVPMKGMRCHLHQAKPEDLVPGPDLPAGVAVPAIFQDPAWQHALTWFVAEIYRDYTGLNTGADLRQILAAGAAHVRLVFGTETLDPKDIELLSRVVDRHLRNLRATPKEQQAKAPGGDKDVASALAAGAQVGALLERVRGVLSPAQLRALSAGRPAAGLAPLAEPGLAAPLGKEVQAEDEDEDDEQDLGGLGPLDQANGDLDPDPFD